MRSKNCALATLLLFCLLFSVCAQGISAPTKPTFKPKLTRVAMYMWAVSTGGISVDLHTRRMECFVRWSKASNREREALQSKVGQRCPIFRVVANLSAKEVSDLTKLAENSSLRGFVPRKSDIHERRAALDECPPTLVLTWDDGKEKKFRLPLSRTLRPELPAERKRAYKGMDAMCEHLIALHDRYDRKPYLTMVSVSGPEYRDFEHKRDKR